MQTFEELAIVAGDGQHIIKMPDKTLRHFEMEGGFIYLPCTHCNKGVSVLEIRANVQKEYFAAIFRLNGIDIDELSPKISQIFRKHWTKIEDAKAAQRQDRESKRRRKR